MLALKWQTGSSRVVPGLVVDLVTKTRGINNGEGDSRALLVKLELCTASQSTFVLLGIEVLLIRTNGHGLDLDALLDMGAVGVVGVLVADHRLSTESVDKGGPACEAWIRRQQTGPINDREPGSQRIAAFRSMNLPVPDAPQTIKQNWIPFFTFFLRRIIFC